MKKRHFLPGILLLCILLFGSCVQADEVPDTEAEEYKIGVVVYNPDDPEMSMFMNYYRDYIEAGFPVKFYFSGGISSAEDENAFIEAAAEEGISGVISFYGQDVQSTVETCEAKGVYYILGSGSISDEDFEAVEENPWFLGTIGPDGDAEYAAGYDMGSWFAGQGKQSYLVTTGGASLGNFMHASRTRGILDALEEKTGLVMEDGSNVAAASDAVTTFTSEDESVRVTLSPGYTSSEAGIANLEEAFAANTYDAVLSSFYVYPFMDKIDAKEMEQGSDIMTGTVDSFTETNFEAVKTKDAYGNPKLNYIEGKYASMAGPAFAVLYNALTGHLEANSADGKAVRLYQGFWQASGKEEYIELYGYTTGIYENAYSCDDLMQVIRVFSDTASPEALKELTEAYTVEDVKARIIG